jgi:hypothetical protein
MFYGGALLSHVSAAAPDSDEADLVRLLRLNRNAIGMFDRDRDDLGINLKPAVERVKAELEKNRGLAWVTAGREVENYLPPALLKEAGVDGGTTFIRVHEALSQGESDLAKLCRSKGKVGMAQHFRDLLKKEQLTEHLDLAEKLNAVVAYIKRANSIGPAQSTT